MESNRKPAPLSWRYNQGIKMKINISFDYANFASGFVAAMVLTSTLDAYWLLLSIFLLIGAEIKGMPFMKIEYNSGTGWNVSKGRHK